MLYCAVLCLLYCTVVAASLDAAVKAAAEVLAASHKPVLLGGPRLRANHRKEAFKELAEAFKVG
jgi:thiamine pyrophosphate-dependent acetolactate synthase large subunit-like protein